MSEYSSKLAKLADKKKKLEEEESKLINKRKHEIALLAEEHDLLSASNELIAGVFIHAKQAIDSKDSKVKEWEHAGSKSLKQPKKTRDGKQAKESTASVS